MRRELKKVKAKCKKGYIRVQEQYISAEGI